MQAIDYFYLSSVAVMVLALLFVVLVATVWSRHQQHLAERRARILTREMNKIITEQERDLCRYYTARERKQWTNYTRS